MGNDLLKRLGLGVIFFGTGFFLIADGLERAYQERVTRGNYITKEIEAMKPYKPEMPHKDLKNKLVPIQSLQP